MVMNNSMLNQDYIIESEQELQNIASNLLTIIEQKYTKHNCKFIALNGDLGAGKTTLVRYVLKQLNYLEKVKSPTYNLLNSYNISTKNYSFKYLHHFDLYRFSNPDMWLEYGFDEYLNNNQALIFIEWPQNAAIYLPQAIINIWLKVHTPSSIELDSSKLQRSINIIFN